MHYPIPAAWSRQDIINRTLSECDKNSVPRVAGLALFIAESGLNQYSQRFASHAEHAQNLIDTIATYGIDGYIGDYGMRGPNGDVIPSTGRQAWDAFMAEVNAEAPHDISFGLPQFIVKYAPVGDGSYTFENVMTVRSWLFDPSNAIPAGIKKLAGYYREGEDDAIYKALNRFNYPAGDGQPWQGNGLNYRRAIAQAEAILGS